METMMVDFITSSGLKGHGLKITFTDKEEFAGFMDIANIIREDDINLSKDVNIISAIDTFLRFLEENYREVPSRENPDITECFCLIPDHYIPLMFWALYYCFGLFMVQRNFLELVPKEIIESIQVDAWMYKDSEVEKVDDATIEEKCIENHG